MIKRLIALALALTFSACGAGDAPAPSVGTSSAALQVPGLTDVPCDANGVSLWEGTTVELMVADALTECSSRLTDTGQPTPAFTFEFTADAYIGRIFQLMLIAAPGGSFPTTNWANLRAGNNNCSPTTGGPRRPVVLKPAPIKEFISFANVSNPNAAQRRIVANADLRTAAGNLCLAQKLRNRSPGAAGAEALLLSEAEQRELLNVTRERAQVSMVQYALLGLTFSVPFLNYNDTLSQQFRIQDLKLWPQDCENRLPNVGCAIDGVDVLAQMGRDFAASIQLHVTATEELASLLARSRSANSPTGETFATLGQEKSRADENWGAGSWTQRYFAAMFGGDPLAVIRGPWNPGQLGTLAGNVDRIIPGGLLKPYDWPFRLQSPYVETDIAEPQVSELLALARRYDALELIPSALPSCTAADVEQSGTALYQNIETAVRADLCDGIECPNTPPSLPFPAEPYQLWERHRITPEHARTVAAFLAENVNYLPPLPIAGLSPTCVPQTFFPAFSEDSRLGPMNLSGSLTTAGFNGSTNIKLSADSQFVSRPVQDYVTQFTRFAEFRAPLPAELLDAAPSEAMGFVSVSAVQNVSIANEAKRIMGATAALAATRNLIAYSLAQLASDTGNPPSGPTRRGRLFHQQSNRTLALIRGAIGEDSVAVRPALTPFANILVPLFDLPETGMRRTFSWVDVTFSPRDTWWETVGGVTHVLIATSGGLNPFVGPLVSHPESSLNGTNIEQISFDAASEQTPTGLWPFKRLGTGAALPPTTDGAPRYWQGFVPIVELDGGFVNHAHTLYAVRIDDNTGTLSYRLLGSNFVFGTPVSQTSLSQAVTTGQYIATGGSLGTMAKKQLLGQRDNPKEPAYDGFGIPTNYVPPYSAELVGGEVGQASVDVYLGAARSTATEATEAVQQAMDNLLVELTDETELAAATARANAINDEEKSRLCGPNNKTCEINLVRTFLLLDWFPVASNVQCGTCQADPTSCALDKLVCDFRDALLSVELDVAEPVYDALGGGIVPTFSEFAGGSLQSAFIEQWRAIKSPDDRFAALLTAVEAAKGRIAAADAALTQASELAQLNCSGAAMREALVAGTSVSVGVNAGFPGFGVSVSVSFSPGPWLAQRRKCDELELGIPTEQARVVSAQLDAFAGIVAALGGLTDAHAAMLQSSAKVEELLNESQLVTARAELERTLTATGQQTSFGLYRRYRSSDIWRAKALVENARRYALVARRAIEARYVVNLSQLTQPEAFVQSPATWADEIYEYDLSLPNSVGLAVSSGDTDAIYANKVLDYVTNLEGFVKGYAINRPAAVAENDLDVVYFRGLAPGEPVNFQDIDPNLPDQTIFPDMAQWLLRCPAEPATGSLVPIWTPAGNSLASTACVCTACTSGVRAPDRVKLMFTLDPWGRAFDFISNEPFERRYNGRWQRIAVNLIGTGIKNCERAADPLVCFSDGSVRYDLSHTGPAWVSDYAGDWRQLGAPIGRIEGGKALAAELWLDPLRDGFDTPFISAVARTEFMLRPLGGAYELEFKVPPELELDHIERIQLLIGSTYWVRQD